MCCRICGHQSQEYIAEVFDDDAMFVQTKKRDSSKQKQMKTVRRIEKSSLSDFIIAYQCGLICMLDHIPNCDESLISWTRFLWVRFCVHFNSIILLTSSSP
jgi:hypothetical protein